MEPVLIAANPKVIENVGKVAMMRGPVVYALESIDNGDNLNSIFICKDQNFTVDQPCIEDEGNVIRTQGFRIKDFDDLYSYLDCVDGFVPCRISAIPYYLCSNRGKGEMLVWVNHWSFLPYCPNNDMEGMGIIIQNKSLGGLP